MTIKIGWGWIIVLPILLKLFGFITVSWWIVLIPVWIPILFIILFVIFGLIAGRI